MPTRERATRRRMGQRERPCDRCGALYTYQRERSPGYCGDRCRQRESRERRADAEGKRIAAIPRADWLRRGEAGGRDA